MKASLFAKCALATVLVLTVSIPAARADELIYWTDAADYHLNQFDLTTNTNVVLETTPGSGGTNIPDSLIFDSNGNIIYSVYAGSPGSLRSFNPSTHSDTLISTGPVSGFSNQLVDLALDPGGASVLVSDRGSRSIDRVNLSTGVSVVLPVNNLDLPNGIAYVPDGMGGFLLFAESGDTIIQIDPGTGTILKTGPALPLAQDGLTWDPVTGNLFAANHSCIEEINVTTLAGLGCFGTFSDIDGLESDGLGNIIVADAGAPLGAGLFGKIGEYVIGTTPTTPTYLTNAPGLDDIAPLIGIGGPPTGPTPVPEPGSILLLGTAAALIIRKLTPKRC